MHDDILLTLEEAVATTGCHKDWMLELIEENVVTLATTATDESTHRLITGYQLTRIRRAQRLCRDFDASVPAVGLILELLDELEGLRKQVQKSLSYEDVDQVK